MASAVDEFKKALNVEASLVSTVDHPYPSPPVHLFDGHLHLLRDFGKDVLLLNWDVSQPNDRKYRYDLVTDTGLIAKNPALYHYRPASCYAEQTFDPSPFSLLPGSIDAAVRAICRERCLPTATSTRLLRRANQVLQLAISAYSPNFAPWEHTRALLVSYYGLLGQSRLAAFIAARYAHYFGSPITTRWIPWCIRNATDRLSFDAVAKGGLFHRAPLRATLGSPFHPNTPSLEAATLIEQGIVVPSFDVFLWSLAVAGICHYGNDRGFLGRLATFVGNPGIAALQLTQEKRDCRRFLQLNEDYAVPVTISDSVASIRQGPRIPAKLTRITSLSSLLVVAGAEALADYLLRFSRGSYTQETVCITS